MQIADYTTLNQTDNSGISALEITIFLSGILCKNEQDGYSRVRVPYRRCRRCRCAESTIILLKADCAVPTSDRLQSLLNKASYRCKLRYTCALKDRRERLKQYALDYLNPMDAGHLGLLEDRVLDHCAAKTVTLLRRQGIQTPDALGDVVHVTPGQFTWLPGSVYNVIDNNRDADIFFRLGFRDFDHFWKILGDNMWPLPRLIYRLK